MTTQKYPISDCIAWAEFVDNIIHNQKNELPASCVNVDVSLDRQLRAYYIDQANTDIKAYIAAIAPNSGVSQADQDNLRGTLIKDLKNISHSIDEIKEDGAYPAAVAIFQPWKDATDNLIEELSLPYNTASLPNDLTSMQSQLDMAALTFRAYLGEGFEEFSDDINQAEYSYTRYNNAYNTPGTQSDVLNALQASLVNNLVKVQNSGNYILTLIGTWAAGTSDATNTNVVVTAATTFITDTEATTKPISFSTDLNNLGNALTFGQSFVASKFVTLDTSNLIGECVNNIIADYNFYIG